MNQAAVKLFRRAINKAKEEDNKDESAEVAFTMSLRAWPRLGQREKERVRASLRRYLKRKGSKNGS